MTRRRAAADRWQALRNQVRARWDRLTEEDIDNVRGNTERLIAALQARYGYNRQMAVREFTQWSRSLRAAA